MVVHLKMSANGRVCIPADVRELLRLKDGDTLALEVTDQGLILRTQDQSIRAVQAMVRKLSEGRPPYTVDDFIRERREEATREEEQYRARHGD